MFVSHFLQKKENSKRRKDDHNLSRKSKDKKVQLPLLGILTIILLILFLSCFLMHSFGDAFCYLYVMLGCCLCLVLSMWMLTCEYYVYRFLMPSHWHPCFGHVNLSWIPYLYSSMIKAYLVIFRLMMYILVLCGLRADLWTCSSI